MATFPKGTSLKNQRVHITHAVPSQKQDIVYIAASVSNDNKEPENVVVDPMLVYEDGGTKGEHRGTSFFAPYSNDQWRKIREVANSDGDERVINADLIPNPYGSGYLINTDNMQTPDVPFDRAKHRDNTMNRRQAIAARYETNLRVAQPERETQFER